MARKFALFSFILGLLLAGVTSSSAQKFHLNLAATYKSTNSNGVIVTGRMTTPTLLGELFADIASARLHHLVFDIETGEVLIIQKGTGEVLGAWYVFTTDTMLENLNHSKAEVYWTIACPVDEGFQGTAVGTVQVTRTGETITKFKMAGRFVLRYRGDAGTRVFSGVFSTGARYVAP